MDTQHSTLAEKHCAKCQQTKPIFDFGADRTRKHGVKAYCKTCHNALNQSIRKSNLEKYKIIEKNWRDNNKDKMRQKAERWKLQNPNRMTELAAMWRKANPEKARQASARQNEKLRFDPVFRMRHRVASGLRRCLNGTTQQSSVFLYLDYTAQELKAHIEKQFLPGMGWHNMNEWHIDHIVPLAAFDCSDPHGVEFKQAWSLSNLRPLWATDNRKKSDQRHFLL